MRVSRHSPLRLQGRAPAGGPLPAGTNGRLSARLPVGRLLSHVALLVLLCTGGCTPDHRLPPAASHPGPSSAPAGKERPSAAFSPAPSLPAPSALAPSALAPEGAPGFAEGEPAFRGGVVATSHARATQAAAEVLANGGNAVDAALTAAFVLNVVEPQSSGIGGGGFMMVHLARENRSVVLDSRETAPAAASPDMFIGAGGAALAFPVASTSGVAVGVPGMLRGAEVALGRWGTISLAEALAPAIAAAENGIVVDARLADSSREARLTTDCGSGAGSSPWAVARAVFRPGGDPAACGAPLAVGARLVQPALARTLRHIATDGTAAFYDCRHPAGIARAIVATQHASPAAVGARGRGRMTCADLAAYAPVLREPVQARYRGYLIRVPPPPSSGGVTLLQMLKMLERFPLGNPAAGFGSDDAATLNVMQEAMRLAFADRARWAGDTDVVPGLPVAALLDDAYLAARASSCPDGDPADALFCIASGHRLDGVRPGDPRPFVAGAAERATTPALRSAALQQEGTNTTHLAVADRWGNIVSYTNTIESAWGTGLMVPGFGFLLNNELTDFNLEPVRHGNPGDPDFDPGANDAAPGKRPRSSMAPTLILSPTAEGERPVAAFGSPGGSTIINTLLAVGLNLVDDRMRLEEAIARPRLSLTKPGDDATTAIEAGFPEPVLQRLRDLGYRFSVPAPIGAVQAVVIDPRSGLMQAAADARRDGAAAGLP